MFWLTACSVPEALTTRKMWESIIFLDDESVLMLRASQGNTGILKQQSAIRAVRFSDTGPPNEYLLRGRDQDTTFNDQTIKVGSQQITHDDGWNIRIRDSLFNIQANINNEKQAQPISLVSEPDWQSILHGFLLPTQGWIQINDFSGPIFGQAVIFEHTGHRPHQDGQEMWIIDGGNNSLIIEQNSTGTYFFSPEGGGFVEIESQISEETPLNVQEMTLHFEKSIPIGTIDPYEHVSSPERFIVSPIFPTPRLYVSRGYLEIEHKSMRLPARYLKIQKSTKPQD